MNSFTVELTAIRVKHRGSVAVTPFTAGTLPSVVDDQRPNLGHIAAENIRAKRARLQISQRVAAERAGVAPSIWSTIETGQRRLTLDDAWRVCEALGMTLADLLEGAPEEARAALKA